MTIEAMKQARDFISRLKFADAEPEPEAVIAVLDKTIAEASEKESKLLEAVKWIASLDLSGADDRAIALMSYAIVSKARFAVLDATGEKIE